jgi:Flp pilus assembly protein TadD
VNLGIVLFARKDIIGAEGEYRRAVAADPGSAGAHVALALLLARTNRTGEAMVVLRQALALDGAHPVALRLQQEITSRAGGQ